MSIESRRGNELDDPGAELVDNLTGAWERYGRIVLGAVGGIVVIAAVAYFTMQSQKRQEGAAAEKLAQANMAFWQGDYPRALQAAQEIAKQYGGTPSGKDAHRIAGDAAFWRGDFKLAVTEFNAFLAKAPAGVIADAVRRSLAYALESDKQFALAAQNYDRVVTSFDRESAGEMLYAAARCYRAAGKNPEAIQRLERLSNEFGETSVANRGRMMLAELKPPTAN